MKKLFLSLLIICASMQAMAESIVIDSYVSQSIIQDVAKIGKWVFVEDNLQLIDKSGVVLAEENIANIRRITFAPETPASDIVTDIHSIVVYPNPAYDMLYIKGIEQQTLRIYNLQGAMLHSEHGNQITVSSLPMGTYLLQIGTQVVRFIKK